MTRLHEWDSMPKEQVSPTLERRLIWGEKAMLAQVHLRKGAVVPRHHHVHEQFAFVMSGALRFRVGDANEEIVARAGSVLHLPSNVPHEAEILEDSVVLDVFSPPREDWIGGTDAYLRR